LLSATQDDDGWTPAHYAVYYGRTVLLDLLLSAGASADARTAAPAHTTLLHLAAGCGAGGCALLLLRAGADPFARDGDGVMPAQLAAALRPIGHEALACTLAIARHFRAEPAPAGAGAGLTLCGSGTLGGGGGGEGAGRLVPRRPLRLAPG
jgi:hypothetical protein